MVSGILFEGTSLVPIWKTIWSGMSLKTGFAWCHTSNCCTMRGTEKYFRVFSFTWNIIPIDMLAYAVSNYIYTLVLDAFHTFSLFVLFLLTLYWIVLELLKLLVLFWWYLLILLWFLVLSFAILLDSSWSGISLHSLLLQELSSIDWCLSRGERC